MEEYFTFGAYYNTTDLQEEALRKEQRNAASQEQIILERFRKRSTYSPSEIWALRQVIGLGDVPITSIRRSITNLTKRGYLRKTLRQRVGIYGKPEYVWEAVVSQGVLF